MGKVSYFKITQMLERAHRSCLDNIRIQLKNHRYEDITETECLLLYNIGNTGIKELSVGDLTKQRCYLGSNVSHTLGKLIDNRYVDYKPSQVDRRMRHVVLSKKGQDLYEKLDSMMDGTCLRNYAIEELLKVFQTEGKKK